MHVKLGFICACVLLVGPGKPGSICHIVMSSLCISPHACIPKTERRGAVRFASIDAPLRFAFGANLLTFAAHLLVCTRPVISVRIDQSVLCSVLQNYLELQLLDALLQRHPDWLCW